VAGALWRELEPPRVAIVGDRPPVPPARSVAPAAALPADVRGDWVVQSIAPSRALTATEQRFLELETASGAVHVGADQIAVDLRGGKQVYRVERVIGADDGHLRLELIGDSGKAEQARLEPLGRDQSGPLVVATVHGVAITLRRPVF
jgi:hypothetical protein